jgi:hypothetical protein
MASELWLGSEPDPRRESNGLQLAALTLFEGIYSQPSEGLGTPSELSYRLAEFYRSALGMEAQEAHTRACKVIRGRWFEDEDQAPVTKQIRLDMIASATHLLFTNADNVPSFEERTEFLVRAIMDMKAHKLVRTPEVNVDEIAPLLKTKIGDPIYWSLAAQAEGARTTGDDAAIDRLKQLTMIAWDYDLLNPAQLQELGMKLSSPSLLQRTYFRLGTTAVYNSLQDPDNP